MQFRGIIEKLTQPNAVIGLEVVMRDAQSPEFFWVALKKQRGALKVTSRGVAGSWEELKDALPKGKPLAITVNGKGILHKSVAATGTEPPGPEHLLPQVRSRDFYYQVYRSGDLWFGSLIRKQQVDDLLNTFENHGFKVISFLMGPYGALSWSGFVGQAPEKISVNGFSLILEEGHLKQVLAVKTIPENRFPMGEEALEAFHLVAFASGLNNFLPLTGFHPAELDAIGIEQQESRQKRLFTLAGGGILGFFFLLLLGNYFVAGQLNQQLAQLEAEHVLDRERIEKAERLEADLEEKERLIAELGLQGKSRLTWYADRISERMPKSLQLTSMDLFPVEGKRKKEEALKFNPHKIRVEGLADKPEDLQIWLADLEDLPWTDEVKLDQYQIPRNKVLGQFRLYIYLKP